MMLTKIMIISKKIIFFLLMIFNKFLEVVQKKKILTYLLGLEIFLRMVK